MPGRISCPTLVGREAERQRVITLLRGGDRPAPLILLRGEGGIGKSRLLRHVLEELDGEAEVLTGRCVPVAGTSLPYGPILDALRPIPGATQHPQLAALRSSVRRALEVGDRSDGGGRLAQPHLFETAIDALEAAAVDYPLVLAIEDLHWGDAATRDLLAFLVSSRRSSRLILMATVRSDEPAPHLGSLLSELDRGGVLERIDLGPLSDDAVAAVVAGILGEPPDAALVGSITRRAGGNPFFVEELVVAARGHDAHLPPNLVEIMLARLAGLPRDVQATLKVVAALGERCDVAVLAAVCGLQPTTLAQRLRLAAGAYIITIVEKHRVAFRHALMREAIYADLLPSERVALHERVAHTLSRHDLLPDAERQLALALHWDRAERPAMALPALARAAEVAAQAHAYADAADLYARCLEVIREHPEVAEATSLDTGRLHEAAGVAAFRAGDTGTAIEHVRAAIAATDPTADPTRAGVLHQHLCEYLWQHGLEAESIAATAEAYRLVPMDGPAADRVLVVAAWSSALIVTSRFVEALAVIEEGVRLADDLGDDALRAVCLGARGCARANHDDLEGGLLDLEEAVRLSRAAGDPDAQALCYLDAAWAIMAIAAESERALTLTADWEALQRATGTERARGSWLAGVECHANLLLGRWTEADRIIADALRRPTHGPVRLEIAYEAALLRTWMGRYADASAASAESLELARTFIGQQMIGRVYSVAIELATWTGDSAGAIRLFDEATDRMLEPDDPLFSRHLYAAGMRALADEAVRDRSRRRGGDGIAALEARAAALARAIGYEGVPNLTARLPETRAWQAQCAAELMRLRGEPGEVDAWGEAARRWMELRMGWQEAYALWRRAAAQLVRKDRRGAGADLVAGHAAAAAVGAGAVVREIEALAARAQIRLQAAPATSSRRVHPNGLTVRECEVLGLVARGMSNRQIAGELFISEKTAGVHVSNILAKLDVSSRSEAVAVAVRSDVLLARP